MGIDRSGTYSDASSPAPTGLEFLGQYGTFIDALIDTAVLRLARVVGTNAITAIAEPFEVPASGLVTGMKFTLVPANNNTGAVTLNIDARGAKAVLNANRSALSADTLVDGTRYLLEFDGSDFILLGAVASASAAAASRTIYDTTTVWNNTLPANTLVKVELWGAGGGGSTSSGGGGGAYAVRFFTASRLPSSVTITVPAGGAVNTAGGNCRFGTLLTAYGGGGAVTQSGNGGGEITAGGAGPGDLGGGVHGTAGGNARTIHGGGGGSTGNGGRAVYGGGGGSGTGNGGLSKYGGKGGDGGEAGQRPGGGGGRTQAGGGGRAIITIF